MTGRNPAYNGSRERARVEPLSLTSMHKKTTAILVASTCLTLACLCCPANINILRKPPATAPSKPAFASTAVPTPPDVSTVCVQELGQVLEDTEIEPAASSRGPLLDRDYTLVTYAVNGDAITDPVYASVPSELKSYQQDHATQVKIWDFFTRVIPPDQRRMVTGFLLYTDGPDESLGAVEQTDNPRDWMFEMDLIDGGNFPDLATTVMHEFAHLLTLNESQVTTDLAVFNDPGNRAKVDREAATCPNYFSLEGCSQPESYLNAFFDRFWTDIYAEWQTIDVETDQGSQDQKLSHFYRQYASQFVSEYAATSPSEDIAESFMFFIFDPKPSGAALSDQKVLFFYEYPELVALRGEILSGLCTYMENR